MTRIDKAWILAGALAIAVMGLHPAPSAGAQTPVGYWKTIDDRTDKEKSVVEIREENGRLYGKVVKLFSHPGDPPPLKTCDKCPGDKKGKPIVGLTILWDMTSKGDGCWSGGYILDPKNGKTYRCKITLSEDDTRLTVRGYIGFSLLGRSQKWYRVEKP